MNWTPPTIYHGVPFPAKKREDGRNKVRPPSPWIEFWAQLRPGNSFKVPYRERGAPLKYAKQLGLTVVTADEPWDRESGQQRYLRIWLVATGPECICWASKDDPNCPRCYPKVPL